MRWLLEADRSCARAAIALRCTLKGRAPGPMLPCLGSSKSGGGRQGQRGGVNDGEVRKGDGGMFPDAGTCSSAHRAHELRQGLLMAPHLPNL